MSCGAAPSPSLPPQPDPYAAFLVDAQQNLAVVYETFGAGSDRCARLVAHYRVAADTMGCRARMEQVLASLTPPTRP